MQIDAPKPLEEVRAEKLAELKDFADTQYTNYLNKYSKVEQESFKNKAEETAAVLDNPNIPMSQTPYLQKLVGGSVAGRAQLVAEIDAKLSEVTQMETYAKNKRAEINACSTVEELEAVVIGG